MANVCDWVLLTTCVKSTLCITRCVHFTGDKPATVTWTEAVRYMNFSSQSVLHSNYQPTNVSVLSQWQTNNNKIGRFYRRILSADFLGEIRTSSTAKFIAEIWAEKIGRVTYKSRPIRSMIGRRTGCIRWQFVQRRLSLGCTSRQVCQSLEHQARWLPLWFRHSLAAFTHRLSHRRTLTDRRTDRQTDGHTVGFMFYTLEATSWYTENWKGQQSACTSAKPK